MLFPDTKTPMLGWVEQMARAETRRPKKMTGSEGETAIRHQLRNSGAPATSVTCRRPNCSITQRDSAAPGPDCPP